jgi:hypothetical protein
VRAVSVMGPALAPRSYGPIRLPKWAIRVLLTPASDQLLQARGNGEA